VNASAAPGPLARARLAAVRAEIFSRAGIDLGAGILYGAGFKEGMLAGLRITRGFCGRPRALPPRGPEGAPMLSPAPEAGRARRWIGELAHSAEASCGTGTEAGARQTGCIFTSGFAAGWYSALLGEGLLVREVECVARGATSCRFEARPVADWLARAETWTRSVLPHLDFKEICRAALAEATPALPAPPTPEADRPPAAEATLEVRTWGPVLVLPYAGPDECARSLEAAAADPECEPSAIAVVDCAGVEPAEAALIALARTLGMLEARGIEPILSGWPPSALGRLESARANGATLCAADVPAAIALAFQLLSGPGRAS
jgi:hypothetical protein